MQKIIEFNQADAPEANPVVDGPKNNQLAVARILRAWVYWKVTDRWGDVPYARL